MSIDEKALNQAIMAYACEQREAAIAGAMRKAIEAYMACLALTEDKKSCLSETAKNESQTEQPVQESCEGCGYLFEETEERTISEDGHFCDSCVKRWNAEQVRQPDERAIDRLTRDLRRTLGEELLPYRNNKVADITVNCHGIARQLFAGLQSGGHWQPMRESGNPKNVIRLDEDGEVDDVAISGNLFRMERMNDGDWWVCIYRGDKRTAFSLTANCNNKCILSEDSIGCHDDTKPTRIEDGAGE